MAAVTSAALGRLSQRVAIITGASSGIGLATAKLFAQEGANVVATGRNQQSLDKLVAEINASGGQALAVVADVTNDAQIANVVTQAINAFGQVNILVNNAGIYIGAEPEVMCDDDWNLVLQTNLQSIVWCSQAAFDDLSSASNRGHQGKI